MQYNTIQYNAMQYNAANVVGTKLVGKPLLTGTEIQNHLALLNRLEAPYMLSEMHVYNARDNCGGFSV